MTIRPKVPADIALAPVAAEIDRNLQALRDKDPAALDVALQVQLDRPPFPDSRDQRANHVLQAAVRDVELHGWSAAVTPDSSSLHLAGGSVTLDLGLGPNIARYIDTGTHV